MRMSASALCCLALAACQPAAPPTAPALAPSTPAIRTHAPGVTLHYTRSNQDGSMAERVLVHVVSDREVAVAKMVAPCTSAALVMAQFDPATGEAVHLTGGRLGRDGQQEVQATIDLTTPAVRQIDLHLDADSTRLADESITIGAGPWRLYDFDFAEFALFGLRDTASHGASYAITWPEGDPPMLRLLGDATFTWLGAEGDANRYRMGGPAFGAKGGEIKLDAVFGHVVEARLAAPNHPGYANYLLKLDRIVNGEPEWRAELARHWAGCPA